MKPHENGAEKQASFFHKRRKRSRTQRTHFYTTLLLTRFILGHTNYLQGVYMIGNPLISFRRRWQREKQMHVPKKRHTKNHPLCAERMFFITPSSLYMAGNLKGFFSC